MEETRPCPFCGEAIKTVAIRCKHCHADLAAKQVEPDFDRGGAVQLSPLEFERRFLEFAYQTQEVINGLSVAHALKIPIAQATERLEELAANDILVREVDNEGWVYFVLPGRPRQQLVPTRAALAPIPAPGALAHTPSEGTAVLGLGLNTFFLPGLGSMVAGKPGPGIAQLILFIVGVPLSFVLVGLPLVATAWIWGLLTSASVLAEVKRAQHLSAPPHDLPPM